MLRFSWQENTCAHCTRRGGSNSNGAIRSALSIRLFLSLSIRLFFSLSLFLSFSISLTFSQSFFLFLLFFFLLSFSLCTWKLICIHISIAIHLFICLSIHLSLSIYFFVLFWVSQRIRLVFVSCNLPLHFFFITCFKYSWSLFMFHSISLLEWTTYHSGSIGRNDQNMSLVF
jgi:hypothetical protein